MAEGDHLVEFIEVMRRLRAECPWKAEQTHRSLARYLLEETHETLEAIDAGDPDHLREELGDLLLQIYFHAEIAREAGEFTIDDVAADLAAKMVRRNPHVFGADGPSSLTPAEVNAEWERRKGLEKASRTSVLDGLPPGLPGLLLADKVLDRLSRVDPERVSRQPDRRMSPGTSDDVVHPATGTSDVLPRSDDPADDPAEDLGERLLGLVREAREAGVDPEQALRDAVRRELGRAGR